MGLRSPIMRVVRWPRDVRVVHRHYDLGRHRLRILAHDRVNGRHHPIEMVEQCARIVEAAVGTDIDIGVYEYSYVAAPVKR